MISFDILTLFPGMFDGVFEYGVIGRAKKSGLLGVAIHDLRQFGKGRHRMLDDAPFGGGDGMVMMAEPIEQAIESVAGDRRKETLVVLTTPQGKPFDRNLAEQLAKRKNIAILCGRYAGVDERIREKLVDLEISVGDYILSGGEIAAMVIVDAVGRFCPGVLGNEDSVANDSFPFLLEEAQYTRPREWRGMEVPEILLGGDHAKIARWRAENRLARTKNRRPNLYKKAVRRLEKLDAVLKSKKKK